MIKRFLSLRPVWRFAILLMLAMVASLLFTDSAPLFNMAIMAFASCIAGYHLIVCPEEFNDAERLGVGLFAAGMIMSAPALWIGSTPFDDWSINVGRAGSALFFYAVVRRRIHDRQIRNYLKGAHKQ